MLVARSEAGGSGHYAAHPSARQIGGTRRDAGGTVAARRRRDGGGPAYPDAYQSLADGCLRPVIAHTAVEGVFEGMKRITSLLPAIAAGLVLVLAACTGGGTTTTTSSPSASASASESAAESAAESTEESGAPAGEGESVMLQDFAFSPSELTIPVGTTVTFMNMDSAPHTATNGSDGEAASDAAFDLQLAPSGGTGEFTFDEAGTYQVTCKIHPAMNMTITVE
jgi:plastocyanin